MMHSGTDRPRNQASRSELELESHHVGVSHRAAQRWFDLLLPAHGHPHNSGAVTAAKQRRRSTNRHDSVFFRDVAPAEQDPKWALPLQDGEQPIMHGARNKPLNFDQAMDMWRRKRKTSSGIKGRRDTHLANRDSVE